MRLLRVATNDMSVRIGRSFTSAATINENEKCQVLIVGGGTGGCPLAAKLSNKLGKNRVIVLEPSDKHYYQPMFTLIGGGMERLDRSYRPTAQVMSKNAKWLQDKATEFDPKRNRVVTAKGKQIEYELLLIATGLQLNYDRIPGMIEALSIPNGKVCSNYSPKYVERTYDCLQNIKHGKAIFTFPDSAVKCPGAPQKILYIAEHYFRKLNKRTKIQLDYNTSLPVIFGVKHYADALWKVVEKRNINVNTRRNLIEIKPEADIAIFQNLDNPCEQFEEKYSMLHVVPPMSTPNEISKCTDLVNKDGYINVDKSTMQHIHFKNVFAIGDCAGSPNSKTAASAAAQSPVVFRNMIATINGQQLKNTYDGYASCPLVTGYNSCILAEFDYSLTPLETFPMRQDKERYSMFVLKKHIMPALYWNLMLKGHWNGPSTMRNVLSVFKQNH